MLPPRLYDVVAEGAELLPLGDLTSDLSPPRTRTAAGMAAHRPFASQADLSRSNYCDHDFTHFLHSQVEGRCNASARAEGRTRRLSGYPGPSHWS